MLGTVLDFQFLVINDLATSKICVTTVRKQGGKVTIPRFNSAILGLGGDRTPVIHEIYLNTLPQKLVRCLQDQNMCKMLPTAPQSLQHSGEME